jgi:hypothetical protein
LAGLTKTGCANALVLAQAQRAPGESNESTSIGEEGLPSLQDHSPARQGARDLQGRQAQAASRLISTTLT